MDYNYIRLENQIKALMNQNHVPSSTVSKIAESLKNGTLEMYIDTVQNRFVFKYLGINNPVSIDPLKKEILNVELLNGVSVANLVGGIKNGYGINIEETAKGVFKISVDETMIASKADLSNVEAKFDDYTTTVDLEANYATKAELNDVDSKLGDYATKNELNGIDSKFNNYTTTADLEANYATKTTLSAVEAKFDDYTTTADLEANYATKNDLNDIDSKLGDYVKKEDVIPPSEGGDESLFDTVNGYNYFAIKHSDLTIYSPDDFFPKSNFMKINIPDELRTQLTEANKKTDLFKITLRSQIITDINGNILNDFIICYNNNSFDCPSILLNQARKAYELSVEKRGDPEIIFAKELSFDAYTEYINGELIIEYLLNQDSLVSKKPTIKCDIIDAKNALKLRESDVHYLYKPNQISFNKDVKYLEGDTSGGETEWSCECYEMVFKIPNNYTIPINLNFKFIEYCFGNRWGLEWDGTKWCGENIQGRRNSKVMRKISMRTKKDAYGASGCYIGVKNDDWNRRHIKSSEHGLAYSLFADCIENGKFESKIMFNDGTTAKCTDYDMVISYSYVRENEAKFNGYDLVGVSALYNNYSTSKLNVNDINAIYIELTQPNEIEPNILSFTVPGVHREGDVYNRGYIDLSGSNDAIEIVGGTYSKRSKDIGSPENGRDIILYLHKDYIDPIDEINWDPTTNPFEYIIKQQFYEIFPNPNAATTLYTDFNITSSKIITADNITTMRSDLNIVANNVDVINYDVRDIKLKVDVLNSEMAETKEITQHLQKDVKQNRIIAGVALAFGVIGTVGSAASIGMQLASNGISFATKGGASMLKNCAAEGMEHEMNVESVIHMSLPLETYSSKAAVRTTSLGLEAVRAKNAVPFATRIVTDLTPILTWCDEEYTAVTDIPFEEEYDNPKTKATSLYTTIDIANRYRDSLKPIFKKIANKVEEVSAEIENIGVSDQIATLETEFNKKLEEYAKLTNLDEYVNHDELVREDIVDIFPKVDNQNHVLTFEFEGDTLYDGSSADSCFASGLLVFKIYAGAMISQMLRRLYIKIADGQIVEYKGVQDSQITVEGITIEPAAKSEDYRIEFIPTAELNVDSQKKYIKIPIIDPTVKIAGAVIEHNTFKRQMVYTTNDIAYLQDIEALNKKIDVLAEQSHTNDIQTFSIQDEMREEFATVDEVNTVLGNYVQIKDLPPAVDMSEYAKLTNLEEYAKAQDLQSYRKKNDLLSYTEGTIRKNVEFNILRSNPFTIYTVDLDYLEGSHIILKYNDVVYDIDFKIDAETQQGSDKFYDCNLTENTMLRWLVNSSNKSQLVLLDNNRAQIYELVSIVYNAPDEFALKSELNETIDILDTYARNHKDLEVLVGEQIVRINELNTQISKLETENTSLKAQLAAVKPIYPWTSYYEGFDERVEFINNYHVIRSINYIYSSPGNIIINVNISLIGNTEYLLIILNKDKSLTYIRIDPNNRHAYLNEISGSTLYSDYSNGYFPMPIDATLDATVSSNNKLAFNYVFRKPVVV